MMLDWSRWANSPVTSSSSSSSLSSALGAASFGLLSSSSALVLWEMRRGVNNNETRSFLDALRTSPPTRTTHFLASSGFSSCSSAVRLSPVAGWSSFAVVEVVVGCCSSLFDCSSTAAGAGAAVVVGSVAAAVESDMAASVRELKERVGESVRAKERQTRGRVEVGRGDSLEGRRKAWTRDSGAGVRTVELSRRQTQSTNWDSRA